MELGLWKPRITTLAAQCKEKDSSVKDSYSADSEQIEDKLGAARRISSINDIAKNSV